MKNTGSKAVIWVIVGAVIAIVYGVMTYNSIVTEKETITRMASDIQTEAQRRYELIPNLVETVKGHTKHEEAVYTQIAEARAELGKTIVTGDTAQISKADGELTAALGKLIAVQERYPDLESDKLFIQLMDEISGSENRVNIARLNYNEAVGNYNGKISRVPTNIVANLFGFQKLPLIEVPKEETENPSVSFE